MKVFNVSPHRSGTQSFHHFCAAHGLASAHWPGAEIDEAARHALPNLDSALLWQLCAGYFAGARVFSDFPTALIYPHAAAEVPDARFVLIRRDPADWAMSVRRHTHGRDLGYLESFFYHRALGRQNPPNLNGYGSLALIQAYRDHCATAEALLAAVGAPLFAGSLDDPTMPARLAAFLGFRQQYPFPAIA